MAVTIRPLQHADVESVVALSLCAWAPVFDSLREVLGTGLFERMHTDWRQDQQRAVEEVCADEQLTVSVAEVDGDVVGFTAIRTYADSRLGEIYMIAVDPAHQGRGIGASLTRVALEQLVEAGMTMAMVETGGDPGHAPARATYEQADFTLLPIARYFKAL